MMPTELPGGLVTLLGLLAPVLIQLVSKYLKNEMARFLVSLLLSGLTGVAAMAWNKIPWNLTPEFIGLWFTFATLSYKLFWKPFVFKYVSGLGAPPTKY